MFTYPGGEALLTAKSLKRLAAGLWSLVVAPAMEQTTNSLFSCPGGAEEMSRKQLTATPLQAACLLPLHL